MNSLEKIYQNRLNTPSDINEHLAYLYELVKSDCNTVLELGVRNCVSTYAFLKGLYERQKEGNFVWLLCNDILYTSYMDEAVSIAVENKLRMNIIIKNDLEIEETDIEKGGADLVFIDTIHCYGQLKRELDKFHSYAKKYIVMHDTALNEIEGEFATYSSVWYDKYKVETGFTHDEFLDSHKEWRVKEVFTHNNGLTVLERIQ
jgi:hypothetical protein